MSERTEPDWSSLATLPSWATSGRPTTRCATAVPWPTATSSGWSLFAYRDVVEAVRDPATFTSTTKRRAIPNGMDPPEHTVYRQTLAPYFTSERMAAFEPYSRAIAAASLAPHPGARRGGVHRQLRRTVRAPGDVCVRGLAGRRLEPCARVDARQPGSGIPARS